MCPQNRYPGPPPFEDNPKDHQIFFGRDAEIESITEQVIATRILVIFGKSGLGKTSLLQAGIFPRLRLRERCVPINVRIAASGNLLDLVHEAAVKVSADFNIDYIPGETNTLWEYFKTTQFWQDDTLMVPVLVFDQFEEIFTLRGNYFRSQFASEIGPLVSGHPPDVVRNQVKEDARGLSELPPKIKIIISLREEYLGAMQELSSGIPMLFQDRVRLLPLSEKQARDAIEKPALLGTDSGSGGGTIEFSSIPFRYESAALGEMLGFLKGRSDQIEPFQLQLLCKDAEENILPKIIKKGFDGHLPVITAKDLGGPGAMKKVLQQLYTGAMNDVHRKQRRHTRLLCETGLLTKSGHRIPLEENQIHKDYCVRSETLKLLIKRRILRMEHRLESRFYEISHDTLAQSILEIRRWRIPKKYRLALSVGAVAILSLLLSGGWFVYRLGSEKDRSNQARLRAEEMVGFLISDELTEMVNPVGRLEMKEQIQKTVNEYFDDILAQGSMDQSHRYLGLARINQGEVQEQKGRLQPAKANYLEAKTIFEKLVKTEPENMDHRRRLADAIHHLGDIAMFELKVKEALAFHKEAFGIRQGNIDRFGMQEKLARDLAKSHCEIGKLLMKQGYVEKPCEHFMKAIAIANTYQSSSLDIKKWLYVLQDAYEGIAFAHEIRGEFKTAEKIYTESIGRAEEALRLSPYEPHAKYRLGIAIYRHANMILERDCQKASAGYERLSEILKEMTQWDPDNAYWRREDAATQLLIGDAYYFRENPESALHRYRNALSIFEKLARIDEINKSWVSDISWAHQRIGEILSFESKYDEAIDHFDQAIAIQKHLTSIDDSNSDQVEYLAKLYILLGRQYRAKKQNDRALDLYRSAVQILEKRTGVDPTDAAYLEELGWAQFEMAGTYIEKGDMEKADQINERSRATLETALAISKENYSVLKLLFFLYGENVISLARDRGDLPSERMASKKAMSVARQLTSMDPGNAVNANILGKAHRIMGRMYMKDDAIQDASRAFEDAKIAYQQAIRYNPDIPSYWNALFLLYYEDFSDLHERQKEKDKYFQAHKKALVAVQKVVEIAGEISVYQGNLSMAQSKIGRLLLEQDKVGESQKAFAAAETAIRKAISLNPKYAYYWNGLFLLYYEDIAELKTKQKDSAAVLDAYKEALEAIEKAVALSPRNIDYNLSLANVHQSIGICYENGKQYEHAIDTFEKAEKAFRAVISLKEDKAVYWETLYWFLYKDYAGLYMYLENHGSAISIYRRALDAINQAIMLTPQGALNYRNKAHIYFRIGLCLVRQGKFKESVDSFSGAARSLTKSLEIDTKSPECWNDLFVLYQHYIAPVQEKLKDAEGAEITYELAFQASQKAIGIAPKDAECLKNCYLAHKQRGMMLEAKKRPEAAMAAFKQAEQAIREAINSDQEKADYWNQLFLLLNDYIAPLERELQGGSDETGTFDYALEASYKAVMLSPEQAEYQSNYGLALKRKGVLFKEQYRYEKALHFFKKAISAYREAIRCDDKTDYYYNQIVLLLLDEIAPLLKDQADYDGALAAGREASEIAQKAILLSPKDPIHHFCQHVALNEIGNLLEQRGEIDAALVAFKKSEASALKSVSLDQSSPEYWTSYYGLMAHIARVYNMLGDRQREGKAYRDAVTAAEKATALSPESEDYQYNLSVAKNALASYQRSGAK